MFFEDSQSWDSLQIAPVVCWPRWVLHSYCHRHLPSQIHHRLQRQLSHIHHQLEGQSFFFFVPCSTSMSEALSNSMDVYAFQTSLEGYCRDTSQPCWKRRKKRRTSTERCWKSSYRIKWLKWNNWFQYQCTHNSRIQRHLVRETPVVKSKQVPCQCVIYLCH